MSDLVYSPAGKMLAKNTGAVTREDVETFMGQSDRGGRTIPRGAKIP